MKDLPERSSLRSRIGWFALLYVGGVLATSCWPRPFTCC